MASTNENEASQAPNNAPASSGKSGWGSLHWLITGVVLLLCAGWIGAWINRSYASIEVQGNILKTANGSKPTEVEAQKVLSQMITTDSNNLMVLQSFVKTNGMKRGGDDEYAIEFTGVALLQEDCVFGTTSNTLFSAKKGIPERIFLGQAYGRKGQKLKFHGHIIYLMTERGWRAEDVQCHADFAD